MSGKMYKKSIILKPIFLIKHQLGEENKILSVFKSFN